MGEEKPEEELMGKRKSSPRLSATPLRRYPSCFPNFASRIPEAGINFPVANFTGVGSCDSMISA
ncbi:MAG TPA: hypothetical protein DEP07_08665 [Brevibacillus sp.]|nr:hypothetical protein EDM60_17675 [Brevibacillus parabrevis]HBZ80439.1 hypothetical protein [Brevibacillus sp.]